MFDAIRLHEIHVLKKSDRTRTRCDQPLDASVEAALRRQQQRRGVVLRAHHVRLGAGTQQRLHAAQPPALHRQVKRRDAAGVTSVDGRARSDE